MPPPWILLQIDEAQRPGTASRPWAGGKPGLPLWGSLGFEEITQKESSSQLKANKQAGWEGDQSG